jgi:hypothetical protein
MSLKKTNETQWKNQREKRDKNSTRQKAIKMIIVSPFLSVITLNVNGLNTSIRRQG